MDSLAMHLEPFLGWLLRTTWQAGILIGLILLVQKVLGRRLGVRGRYCLWFLVLIRMVLPWTLESPVSVHNLLSFWPLQRYQTPTAPVRVGLGSVTRYESSAAETSGSTGSAVSRASKTSSARHRLWQWPREYRPDAQTVAFLSLIWLAGVCSLAGCILASNLRLRRLLRRGRPVTDRWILGLLEDCKRTIGTRAAVGVIATDRLDGPALLGVLRPRLLLPRETLARRDRSELRHIFLHELAHLKRHDILIGHMASLLHVLHWFNPLIALGFRRMRGDRELACDGLVLSALPEEEAPAYGRTIVLQIEQSLMSRPRWLLAGLSGDKARIRERIAMISRFRRGDYRWSPLAILLVGGLACVGLTERLGGGSARGLGVEPPATAWDGYARGDFPTTHQDKHANIQRCCLRNLETGKYLAVDGERVTCEANEPGEAGLWEFRFDEVSNIAESVVYFYSVPARKYLTSDREGNLAVSVSEPGEAAAWGTYPHPQGVWLISHYFKDGYLRLDEQGPVNAVNFGRDSRSYWDVHTVWRIKTSDDPKSNPQWQREHIPGPIDVVGDGDA